MLDPFVVDVENSNIWSPVTEESILNSAQWQGIRIDPIWDHSFGAH